MIALAAPAGPRGGHGAVTQWSLFIPLLCLLGCGTPAPSGKDEAPSPSTQAGAPAAGAAEELTPPGAPVADPAADDLPPIREDGTILASATMMGTSVSVNVHVGVGGDAAKAKAAIEEAFFELARIESIASEWDPESELSRLNAAAGGDFVSVSDELFELLERSKAVSEATSGTFDVTFHAVGRLWWFRPGAKPPKPEAIAAALPLVGWRGIELTKDGKRARLTKVGMAVGMGAIAKGYAVDMAARVLKQHGYTDFIVEGGGDTYVAGTKGGAPWKVGVQDPETGGALGYLTAKDESIVTSGNYQRFFEYEGERYAHILDPKTGWPIPWSKSSRSVTVVAPNATDADAYATAIYVMGAEVGVAFAEAHPNLDALVIDAEGVIRMTKGLESRWQPIDANVVGDPLE